ncbi:hypothetical protein EDC05_000470 [Coemansia umbellata]|uniref:Uncharacterized protein n=1 Tax=Coemansia umbellata TaxID=1424467 RepID=A0ABQ8PU93_9FUNG|nr:hypothetical protein EDC05_000470 [Coemansia umbellata]
MTGDRKKSGLKGKLRAFSSTSHLRDLVRNHGATSSPLDSKDAISPTPPLPRTLREKESMQSLNPGGKLA